MGVEKLCLGAKTSLRRADVKWCFTEITVELAGKAVNDMTFGHVHIVMPQAGQVIRKVA